MNKQTKYFLIVIAIILFLLPSFWEGMGMGYAQCAMCKANVESNLKGGGTIAKGLNTGILYLMAVPYIIIALIFRKQIGSVYRAVKTKYFPAKG